MNYPTELEVMPETINLIKAIDSFEEEYFEVAVPEKIYNKFDSFSKEFCGTLYGHLSDNDENEGQRFRVWIYREQLKENLKGQITQAKETLKEISRQIEFLETFRRYWYIAIGDNPLIVLDEQKEELNKRRKQYEVSIAWLEEKLI